MACGQKRYVHTRAKRTQTRACWTCLVVKSYDFFAIPHHNKTPTASRSRFTDSRHDTPQLRRAKTCPLTWIFTRNTRKTISTYANYETSRSLIKANCSAPNTRVRKYASARKRLYNRHVLCTLIRITRDLITSACTHTHTHAQVFVLLK